MSVRVDTTRFGSLEIEDDRVLMFPKGLIGFPDRTRYCLLQPEEGAVLFFLQSIDEPALMFVVTDPALFAPDYSVSIRKEQMAELGLYGLEDAYVFVIVNKVDQTLTGNLQGPLVINARTRDGMQLLCPEWPTRYALVTVEGGR